MNEEFLHKIGNALMEFNIYSVIFRVFLSSLVGGCIGFERSYHGRAAGLRTHILVCVGATMTVLSGLFSSVELGLNNDPMRIGAQVISGIGFLGAGTIMTRNETQVTGLTTAAGLWTTASIGIAIGMGFYLATAMAFLVVITTTTTLTKLEGKQKKRIGKAYYLEMTDITHVNEFCDAMDGRIRNVQIVSAKSGISNHVGLICFFSTDSENVGLLQEIREIENVVIAVRT